MSNEENIYFFNLKKKAANLLMLHEGLELKPYKDTKGVLTIGYGRNLEDKGISKSEAQVLLENDIELWDNALRRNLYFYLDLSVWRKVALISMCHTMGVKGLLGFKKMLQAFKDQDYETAAKEALDSKWAREDVGKIRSVKIAHLIREG